MPRLILFPQTDERPTPAVDGDSDGWWAGVQRCFVAVPIAGTLVVVALSASLAFGLQQQTDEIVPQAPTIAVEEYWQVQTPPYPPARFLYLPDPEEIPAGSLFGVPEEDAWSPTWVAAQPRLLLLWPVDDELPVAPVVFAPEEDFWLPPILRLAGPAPIAWAVDDDFPGIPPTPLGVDEDYWWTAFSLPDVLYAPVLSADDEIVPLPPPTEYALDSGTWVVQRVASGKRAVTVW